MISEADIRSQIDGAEASYDKCWTTLCRLKTPNERAEGVFLEEVLDFQPTLARALHDLSQGYRALHQERRNTVAKKHQLSPEWFRRRMSQIDRYQRAIKATISIGKQLGDSFAWIFYELSRDQLSEHVTSQRQLHAPPGIGGLGELNFIEGNRIINGHLVLYHGLTTFLRLGDISFINVEDGSLAAIAELKTTQVSQNELSIHVSTVSSRREALLFLEEFEVEQGEGKDAPDHLSLPQHMQARLNKQLVAIGEAFKLPDPDERADLEGDYWGREVEALVKVAKTTSFVYRRATDGLLLMGIRTRDTELSTSFSRVLGFAAWREGQVTAHGVPGLAKGGYYGRHDAGEITNRATP